MLKLIVRLIINALAIWAAALILPGVALDTSRIGSVLIVAVVFGLVNALIKPLVKLLSFPAIVLTLGLFTLVINAALFGLTAWLTDALAVANVWSAFWGAIIASIVSWLLSIFVSDD